MSGKELNKQEVHCSTSLTEANKGKFTEWKGACLLGAAAKIFETHDRKFRDKLWRSRKKFYVY